MITKRFMAPLLASLVLGLAAAPAQAAPVNYFVNAITSTLSFSGPDGGSLTHTVNPPGGEGLEATEFNTPLDDSPGISSEFSIGTLVFDGAIPYDSFGSFNFLITNFQTREFLNASYRLALDISILFDEYNGDGEQRREDYIVDMDFSDLGDLNFSELFTAEFTLSGLPLDGFGQVEVGFAGSGLWLSGLVPAGELDTIGDVPGGGTDVPEPGSLALLGLGLVGLGAVRRARRLR